LIDLGVNIDHVATLRQARGTSYPEPAQAVVIAEQSGADLITLHLREDRRHIVDRDVYLLKQIIQTRMNLEMAATEEMVRIACDVQPEDVCIVPEKREELTTEGGLNVIANRTELEEHIACLKEAGVRVSLFIDPDPEQIHASCEVGAEAVEIHTGAFADAGRDNREEELGRIKDAVGVASKLPLRVNGGHGLHYHNVRSVAAIAGFAELNIGHAIIARAVFSGLGEAVAEMKRLIDSVSC
jgi:pyridoxine 5-phosphate synthase|tara:strand:- start:1431 stop:2153 length:723 start_codon:yes stop_codon:yes gene_type:complete